MVHLRLPALIALLVGCAVVESPAINGPEEPRLTASHIRADTVSTWACQLRARMEILLADQEAVPEGLTTRGDAARRGIMDLEAELAGEAWTQRPVPEHLARLSDQEAWEQLATLVDELAPACREFERVHHERGPTERVDAPLEVAPGVSASAWVETAPRHRGAREGDRPVSVRIGVELANRTDEPVTLPVRGCTVLGRAYPAEAPDTPAWDPAREWHCTQPPYEIALAPGESHVLDVTTEDWQVLRSGSAGIFHFTALLRLADRTVEIDAGSVELGGGVEGLKIEYEHRVEGTLPRRLIVEATAVNTKDRTIYIEHGACALQVRAHRSDVRSDDPAWRSELRGPYGVDPRTGGYACPLYGVTRTIPPGDRWSPHEFHLSVPFEEIHGDTLPAGRYELVAQLSLNQIWTEAVGIGAFELETDPREARVDDLSVRAETERVGVRDLRFELTLTNHGERGVEISPDASCPVRLHGFRTTYERGQLEDGRTPDWEPDCPFRVPALTLAPEASRTFDARLDAPMPYAFASTISLRIDGEPRSILISAGEDPGAM